MPNKLTEAEIQKLIPLVEQTKWHYQLDKFTDESLGLINKSINQARREIASKLATINPKSEFTKQRLETLAQELQDMTVAIQHKITGQIENTALEVAAKSYQKHADILSFGGLVPNFNNVQLTAAQLKSIIDTPLGGKLLNEWVETAFTANIKDKFQEGIATGMLKGESYKNLVKRFKTDAFTGLEKDMEAITRTQVQSINTNAMKDTMTANADIMKGWKWNSVYENRTCIRCMSMDAKDELYPIDGGPQIPLHVNCRCFPEPITKTFRELGVDIDEMEESYRPYTIRGKIDPVTGRVIPGKIGVGGGRIIDTGRFLGSYEDFFKQLPENVQTQMLGPTRFGLHKAGKLPLSELTDSKGNAFLIKELTKQTVTSPMRASIVLDDIIEAASKGQSTLRALDADLEYSVLIKHPERWLEKAKQKELSDQWKKSSSKLLEKHLKLLDTGDITAVEMKQLLNKAVLEDVINSKAFKNEFVFTKKAVQSEAKFLELKRQKALLEFEKSLSKAELNSIEKWAQYEDSINILKYLKDPKDFLRKNTTAKGLKYKKLAEEFTSAVEKAPLTPGIKYRGIKNLDEALLKKYTTPGSVFEFDSYASFTESQKFAETFSGRSRSVIFKLDKEMHDISIMESSKKYKTSEFIEKKGSSYKVVSVSTENGYTVVNLETVAKKEAKVAKTFTDYKTTPINTKEIGIDTLPGDTLKEILFKEDIVGQDVILKSLSELSGADGLPSLVSKEVFEDLTRSGKEILFRSVNSNESAKKFISGELFAGRGVYGNGSYVATTASGMTELNTIKVTEEFGSHSVRAILKPDAKIISFEDALKGMETEEKLFKERILTDTTLELRKTPSLYTSLYYNDPGRWALSKGYDAIDVPITGVKDRHYKVILNRTSLIVDENAYTVKEISKLYLKGNK